MNSITVFFRCCGVTSNEEETVIKEDADYIWIEDANPSGDSYKFDKKTGRCLNDNTTFGASRFITPIKPE